MSTITTTQVHDELKKYVKVNTKVIALDINKAMKSPLSKYARVIGKVKGKFPQFHSLVSRVVQGFGAAKWTPMGQAQFQAKILRNYRQKVNFEVKPEEIHGTYLAEMLEEGKKQADQPISKYIIEQLLLPQVAEDTAELTIDGEYDPAKLGQFGFSLLGMNSIITQGKTDVKNPFFKIPVPVPTAVNILDVVLKFEKNLPRKMRRKGKCKYIFMSDTMADNYSLAYAEEYGENNLVQKNVLKTVLGKREIVGIPWLNDDIIFTTPVGKNGNLGELKDLDNPGRISKIEEIDYIVKIFMDFYLGFDFLINEMVAVADSGIVRGLGNTAKMEAYYPGESETSIA
ncbi:MAG: hypothetical protein ACPGSD_00045 [Flavobacteriales bacterium]